ncbi:MAG: prepilin-type N-terminal cleavage/methylation domain-containing protein [Minisyncoccales bacterium]
MAKFFAKLKSKKAGFTLIELLVVIAIIGTLSGMVLVAMTDTRARARDARRVNDIYQIRKALELYYAENAIYPNLTGWRSSNNATAWAALGTALAPYMKQLPSDPINMVTSPATHATAAGTYTYSYYAGTGTYCPDPAAVRHWYMLVTRLEKTGSVVSPGVKCVNGTYNYSGTLTVGMVQK